MNKVKSQSTLTWILIVFALLVLVSTLGCARTVLVTEGSPVRLGPNIRGKVYTLQSGVWVLSDTSVPLQEGWYLVPPSFVSENKPLKPSNQD